MNLGEFMLERELLGKKSEIPSYSLSLSLSLSLSVNGSIVGDLGLDLHLDRWIS